MFKSLSNNTAKVREFDVYKNWSFNQSTMTERNLKIQTGVSGSGPFIVDQESTNSDGSYIRLIYNSIKKLYYPDYPEFQSSSLSQSFNYNYSSMDTLQYSTRSLGTNVSVLNIPKMVFGEKIKVNSVKITSNSIDYTDDGFNNLKTPSGNTIGNIFYETGHIVITSASYLNLFDNFEIVFKSTQKITEFEVICDALANEFNYTSNVTSFDENNEYYLGIFTASEVTPFVTKIGLYNDNNELLVIGKLPSPIPKSDKIDISFIVRMDL